MTENQRDLLEAIKTYDLDKIKDLINRGVDINAQDEKGNAFLHHVTQGYFCGDCYYFGPIELEIVQLLLKAGADAKIRNNKGYTALNLICGNDEDNSLLKAIRLLLEAGDELP
jgi:ankyrin repeat protein